MALAEQSRLKPVLFALFGVVAIGVIVFLVRYFTHEAVAVRVTAATQQNLLSSVSTNGKVEPVEEYQAHAPFAGVIKDVYVDVGQKVTPGTLLLKMDDADVVARVATARSVLQSAESARNDMVHNGTQEERLRAASDLQAAKLEQQDALKNLALMQQLEQKGAASAGEVASAKQRVQNAQLNLEAVQERTSRRYGDSDLDKVNAQVADARAGLAAAEAAFAAANMRSPIAGSVYSIPVSQFDFVPGGDDLLDVADLNHVQVRAYFDEPEIGKLANGQAVKITWDAKPNSAWHGHVERAPTTVITYGTRNVGECLITVDDAKGDLLPNTNVLVTVTISQRFHVLTIPREALHTDGSKNFVYKVVNNRLVSAPVGVGALNLTQVEITSGLNEHDILALNAVSNRELVSGLEVKTVK